MKGRSEASLLLETHLKELFPGKSVTPEYKFLTNRKFRFDFAVEQYDLAVEIDGGVFSNGRHTRGSGFLKDMEKFNLAAAYGWKVMKFTPQQVLNGQARQFIREWFCPILKGEL